MDDGIWTNLDIFWEKIKKIDAKKKKNTAHKKKNTDFSSFEWVSGNNLFQGKTNTVPLSELIKIDDTRVLVWGGAAGWWVVGVGGAWCVASMSTNYSFEQLICVYLVLSSKLFSHANQILFLSKSSWTPETQPNDALRGRLVEFLVFNSAFGRHRHWLIPNTSYSFIIIVMSSIIYRFTGR